MNKPDMFPYWCEDNNKNGFNNTPTKAEYPQEKVKNGWDINEVPPREWVNFLYNLLSKWIRYLNERVEKISVVGVPVGVALPTFPSFDGTYKCTALAFPDEFGFVLCNGQEIKDKDSPFFGKKVPNVNDNNFLKGSNKDNIASGNENHQVNYDHVHNYAHTHEVSRIKVAGVATAKFVQTFNEKADKKQSGWDYNLTFNGTSRTSDTGNTMLLITNAHETKTLYSSGVAGDAVNGELDEAKTTGIIGNNKLSIEPRNISAVYIIRIK